LVASSQGTVLEGGRGSNTLVGGAGKDLYVVRQRAGGQDMLHGFDAAKGELINLSGTGITSFSEMAVAQGGVDTVVNLPNGQRITLAHTQATDVSAEHFRFDRQVKLPEGYFIGATSPAPEPPTLRPGEVVMNGGAKGVGLNFGASGAEAKLLGTVYERNAPGPATFVAARQEGETDLRNALRGFNPSTDRINLAQLGISDWSELVIAKQQRIVINGLPLANGTSIKTAPNADGRFIDVMYIDGLDPNQLTVQHFVFAPAGSSPYLPEPKPAVAQPLISTPPTAEGTTPLAPASLVHAMAAFAPDAAGSAGMPFELQRPANVPLMAQVA
jgi:Ca2+-binding RTX toxin-like protein